MSNLASKGRSATDAVITRVIFVVFRKKSFMIGFCYVKYNGVNDKASSLLDPYHHHHINHLTPTAAHDMLSTTPGPLPPASIDFPRPAQSCRSASWEFWGACPRCIFRCTREPFLYLFCGFIHWHFNFANLWAIRSRKNLKCCPK